MKDWEHSLLLLSFFFIFAISAEYFLASGADSSCMLISHVGSYNSYSKDMQNLRLFTTRMELVAATVELAQAEIENLSALAELLNVPKPANWPPPLNDENSQRSLLASLVNAEPDAAGWNLWFCIRREPRELVGNAGFKGSPGDGLVEIGYSMLEAHQRNGYCTEAVKALIAWAFGHHAVQTVIAHTLPELVPSIRVMEKCGLSFVGEGPTEDGMQTVRYELPRPRFQSS